MLYAIYSFKSFLTIFPNKFVISFKYFSKDSCLLQHPCTFKPDMFPKSVFLYFSLNCSLWKRNMRWATRKSVRERGRGRGKKSPSPSHSPINGSADTKLVELTLRGYPVLGSDFRGNTKFSKVWQNTLKFRQIQREILVCVNQVIQIFAHIHSFLTSYKNRSSKFQEIENIRLTWICTDFLKPKFPALFSVRNRVGPRQMFPLQHAYSTAFFGKMLRASCVLNIKSPRGISDLTSPIFFHRDGLHVGAIILRKLRGFVEKSSWA